ncbi:hypothetical protein J6590_071980 [Homalodisca vitripennis]|nr:hypothetical protein J6590_071980 [Homalodisca vitripennis]
MRGFVTHPGGRGGEKQRKGTHMRVCDAVIKLQLWRAPPTVPGKRGRCHGNVASPSRCAPYPPPPAPRTARFSLRTQAVLRRHHQDSRLSRSLDMLSTSGSGRDVAPVQTGWVTHRR